MPNDIRVFYRLFIENTIYSGRSNFHISLQVISLNVRRNYPQKIYIPNIMGLNKFHIYVTHDKTNIQFRIPVTLGVLLIIVHLCWILPTNFDSLSNMKCNWKQVVGRVMRHTDGQPDTSTERMSDTTSSVCICFMKFGRGFYKWGDARYTGWQKITYA